MFTQLNPTIPVHVLGKGHGYAFGMIDYGQEHNLIWVTAIDDTGEIWCAPNPSVRMDKNWTMGRERNPAIAADKAAAKPNFALKNQPEPCACAEDLVAAENS
ncbi:hypothetical protein [Croceicoccus marinus]|jgi:hypothetical protein|uniref:hypothetical protein n=1 Tax=Croceicoccus marinus TaxID=450378 RepID=UPI001FD299C8|nr:hypothetical protein [Croceicoccus marinus]